MSILFRSFFSSAITECSSGNKIDNYIKKLDYDLRRLGRISKREIEEALNEINVSSERFFYVCTNILLINNRICSVVEIATPSQSLMLLRCCGNLVPDELPENRTKLVQEIWQTINTIGTMPGRPPSIFRNWFSLIVIYFSGVPLDISHYNTLLKVYLENDYKFSPTEFLEDLKKQGIVPNRVTYQHIITSYCQNGDIVGASRILEYMRDKQLPINRIVFNALVMGHSQNG